MTTYGGLSHGRRWAVRGSRFCNAKSQTSIISILYFVMSFGNHGRGIAQYGRVDVDVVVVVVVVVDVDVHADAADAVTS
jgi:hypothetical protein